jgi:hypothetical protein
MSKNPLLVLVLFISTLMFVTEIHAEEGAEIPERRGEFIIKGILGTPEAPESYLLSLNANADIRVREQGIQERWELTLQAVKGAPKIVEIALEGDPKIHNVTGVGLQGWAVRPHSNRKPASSVLVVALDRPLGQDPVKIHVIRESRKELGGEYAVLQIRPRKEDFIQGTIGVWTQLGYSSNLTRTQGVREQSVTPSNNGVQQRLSIQDGGYKVLLQTTPSSVHLYSMEDTKLNAVLGDTATFDWYSRVVVTNPNGAVIRILGKSHTLTAPLDLPQGVRISRMHEGIWVKIDKPGEYPIKAQFASKVIQSDKQREAILDVAGALTRKIEVQLPAKDYQLTVGDLKASVNEEGRASVHLSSDSSVSLRWQPAPKESVSKSFYTVEGTREILINERMVEQKIVMNYRMTQGGLNEAALAIKGVGDIISVQAPGLASWQVEEVNTEDTRSTEGAPVQQRILRIKYNQSLTNDFSVQIETRESLQGDPVVFSPLAIQPMDALRYIGHIGVRTAGQTKVSVVESNGMTQLSPHLFPGRADKSATEHVVLAFRHGGPEFDLSLRAERITSRILVSQLLFYQTSLVGRQIEAEMDIEVREAPVSQLQIRIPEKYIVSSTQFNGQEINQVAARPQEGRQILTVFLPQQFSGKGMLKLRMEENRPFANDLWKLEPVAIEGAEILREFVAVCADDGIRVQPEQVVRMGEISAAYLPRSKDHVQVAWRAEHTEWGAAVKLSQMPRVIRIDAFHLFTLADESILGSSIMNVLVSGAPVQNLRFDLPRQYRNVDISGEGVRTWKQDGDVVEVQFQGSISGAFTLLATYEMAALRVEEKASFRGLKSAFDVNELGTIALVSPLPYRVSGKEGNVEELEPSRIPKEFQLLYNSPLIAAFQYHDRQADLMLNLTSLQESSRVEQNIETMDARSEIGNSGEVVTRISYQLQSSRSAYLALQVPENYRLWEVNVLDQPVTPVKDNDRLLIPLPVEPGENGRYLISLAIAHPKTDSKRIQLQLPMLDIPLLNASWKLATEEGYFAHFVKGSVYPLSMLQSDNAASGFPWITLILTLALLCLTASMILYVTRVRRILIRVFGVFGVIFFAGIFAMSTIIFAIKLNDTNTSMTGDSLIFQTEVVPADTLMEATVQLYAHDLPITSPGNMFWWVGSFMALVSLVFAVKVRNICRARWFVVLAAALWGYGLATGTSMTMTICAFLISLLLLLIIPLVHRGRSIAAILLLAALWMNHETPTLQAEAKLSPIVIAEEQELADSVHHHIRVSEDDALVTTQVKWSAAAGDQMLLIGRPAVLKEVTYDRQRLVWQRATDGTVRLWAREAGTFDIQMKSVIPVKNGTDSSFLINLPLASGYFSTAAIESAREGKYVFSSEEAVRVGPRESVLGSTTTPTTTTTEEIWLLLTPSRQVTIQARLAPRDLKKETPVYYSEMNHLVQPVSGAVLAQHEFRIRFAQGEQDEFVVRIPEGQIVSSVESPTRHWDFDAKNHVLRVRYEKPVQNQSTVKFITESPQTNLPFEAMIAFPYLEGAESQVGRVTLAVAEDVSVTRVGEKSGEILSSGGLNYASIEGKEYGQIRSREVLGYSLNKDKEWFSIKIKAEGVEPEIRVESNQSIVLTEDRIVLSYQGKLFIDRAGVFSLQMRIPKGFDLDSISANGMTYWTYLDQNDKSLVQLNFNERIRGERQITASLSNNSFKQQNFVQLPKVDVTSAGRETGWYHVQPELGLKVDLVQPQDCVVVNPEEQGIQRSSGLLLRILGKDWKAGLTLTRMDPWIQVDSLQSYHYEEGRIEVKSLLVLNVENSSIRQLRLDLPDNPMALQVRHDRVSNVRREEDGRWLVSFDRRIMGRIDLELSYDRANTQQAGEITAGLLKVVGASRERRFVTIHTHPTIQMIPPLKTDEVTQILWANVPDRLRSFGQAPSSNLIFRVGGEESGITFTVRRLNTKEGLLNVQVVETRIRTRLSDSGYGMTETRLLVRPGDERYLRFRMGPEDRLWTASVNGETAWVWQDGEDWLIPLEKSSIQSETTEVSLFIQHPAQDSLHAPEFFVPLQNITWVVQTPKYWNIARDSVQSNLRLEEDTRTKYPMVNHMWSVSSQSKQTARELIDLGNQLLSEGRVEEAGQAYKSSYNMSQNYEALNRDALVQWNRVRTQQAYMGISQRRGNIQQQTSASQQSLNNMAIPVQGGMDSNALTRLAQRLIEQQNAALVVPAPFTVVLPQGIEQELVFSRPVLVDPWGSLVVDLSIDRQLSGSHTGVQLAVAAVMALFIGACLLLWTVGTGKRKQKSATA